MSTWDVIYLSEGRRHRHLEQFATEAGALAVVESFRADGWSAWAEEVR